jgi:hypothetical protein
LGIARLADREELVQLGIARLADREELVQAGIARLADRQITGKQTDRGW